MNPIESTVLPLLWMVNLCLGTVVLLWLAELTVSCVTSGFRKPQQRSLPEFERGEGDEALAHVSRVAVLIPAHNEQKVIGPTLASLVPLQNRGWMVCVVADNCTDQTAAIARSFGAHVLERFDSDRKGKGFALQFGVDALRGNPPETVIILDADCTTTASDLLRLAATSERTRGVVQGAYLMHAPEGAGLGVKVSELAWLVKTRIRSEGLCHLGGAVQLLGSGMAFPWSILQRQRLGSSHLVEDLNLTLEMASAREFVSFEPACVVHSVFPSSTSGKTDQSRRWEQGHLQVLLTDAPRLLVKGLLQLNRQQTVLALDVMIPPLTLLMLLVGLNAAATGLAYATLVGVPGGLLWAALVWGGCLGLGIFGAWWAHGRSVLTFQELLYLPVYVLRKLALYAGLLKKRETEWIRTERD